MRPIQIEVYQRRSDGLFDWRSLANNGQITGTSGGQGYSSRFNAHRAVKSYFFTALGVEPGRVEIIDVREP